ncbi:hypothetical protein [Allonocardiopsis opalescens]|uniref:Uncharacterized protein n=1 Tax=Allonocardiopsis opalescens TaxID=1144618 RepID=A0A2T0PPM6_9ACTN|nr:hypothetical protein [Allonocardiopsis opalescens]PRX90686.1 hypothetical protein CLV72_11824 [Allonocardiopsis opalescens]
MTQLSYYEPDDEAWSWWGRPPAAEEEEPPADDVHSVRWGYNILDIDRLARLAVRRSLFAHVGSFIDRYTAARDGVIDALYAAQERPTPRDLVTGGWRAMAVAEQAATRLYGRTSKGETRPSYVAYWDASSTVTGSHESGVVDRMALWQIWPTLTDGDRDVLLGLAMLQDREDMDLAAALGVTPAGLKDKLVRARSRFAALWYEGETPRRHKRGRNRVRIPLDNRGRPRITESQLEEMRARRAEGALLKEIAAEYGISTHTASALLRGKSRPAPDPRPGADGEAA